MSIFDEDGYSIYRDSKYGIRVFLKYHKGHDDQEYPMIHLHEIVKGAETDYVRKHKMYPQKMQKLTQEGCYYKSVSFNANLLQELIAKLLDLENKRTGGEMPTMPEAQAHKDAVEDKEMEDDMGGLSDFAPSTGKVCQKPKTEDDEESPF